MDKLNIDNYKNNNLEMSLKKDYIEALKNEDFKKLVVSLKIKDDINVLNIAYALESNMKFKNQLAKEVE